MAKDSSLLWHGDRFRSPGVDALHTFSSLAGVDSVAAKSADVKRSDSYAAASVSNNSNQRIQPILVPNQLGPVKLIRQIARGGMGVVWLGWHELLRSNVAVKFLLLANLSQGDREIVIHRFVDGARAAMSVRHSGLTRILTADVVEGVPYLVMEHVVSKPISAVLKLRGALNVASALGLLDSILRIIAHLHRHDVVHGDIKPSNLLIDRSGELFLTDFGLCCRLPSGPPCIAGTPHYMAPEMFHGVMNPRTDVYAAGIMAYELLAGRLPFVGDWRELRASHEFSPLPRAPLLRRNVPEPIITFLDRATRRDHTYRLRNAGQMLNAMRHELDSHYDSSTADEVLFGLACRHVASHRIEPTRPDQFRTGTSRRVLTQCIRLLRTPIW